MGFYKDGKYVYEPTDVGAGICDQETINRQNRKKQKILDENNAGEIGSGIDSEDESNAV